MDSQITVSSVRDTVTSPEDAKHQFPIHYAYDHLHGKLDFLTLPQLKLNEHLRQRDFLPNRIPSEHGISIDPVAAGLPWASGVLSVRQNKHWRSALQATIDWLKAFGDAKDMDGVPSKRGRSVAEFARHELAAGLENGWFRFPIYMSPDADEQRVKLLSFANILIFLFDDFWETHDLDVVSGLHRVFITRLKPETASVDEPQTSLEKLVDAAVTEMLELDRLNNNHAGRRTLELIIGFFSRPAPPDKYESLEDFLVYRREDAAVSYVLGTIAFALNSGVDVFAPHLARLVKLWSNQISIANDVFSWEKEKRDYDEKKVLYLINTVDVCRRVLGLASHDAALTMTQALLFQIERELDNEIARLRAEDALTPEEWRFVDGMCYTMMGNMFCSVVMSRYGGEEARLRD
ncbi:Fusicoccadiene synthase [Escovopsis weberi]|uniref:Fusicoccadiene synthase n=1 Tax=Escovopsis weberi TaxID=150374 RepID=A0A0M8MUG4_ESCWE|nr:Fusicoccadiene synthase [Escovopsis weberi]